MDPATSEHDYAVDDSTFPAYTDYINGLVEQVESWDAAGPVHDSDHGRETYANMFQYLAENTTFSIQQTEKGPAVVDLRSPPSSPNMVKLIPPEHVQPASPHGPSRPTMLAHDMTAAKTMRQTLLNDAPVQPRRKAAAAQSLHGQTPQRRSNNNRVLPRQASHPKLVRSSSATDVNSHLGQLPGARTMCVYFQIRRPIYTHNRLCLFSNLSGNTLFDRLASCRNKVRRRPQSTPLPRLLRCFR
jgi:hypothetical protein